jgi:hypothetical protein
VAWALEDTLFFTLRCRDMHMQTDHRPLVKLLGDRTLDEINNRRLVGLKEKIFPWKFSISWVPKKLIPAPHATSRNPQDHLAAIRVECETDKDWEHSMVAAARNNVRQTNTVTWEKMRDQVLMQLLAKAERGFPTRMDDMPAALLQFWRGTKLSRGRRGGHVRRQSHDPGENQG